MTPVEASQKLIAEHGWPSDSERKAVEFHVEAIVGEMLRCIAAGGDLAERMRGVLVVRFRNMIHQRNAALDEVARLRQLVETMDDELTRQCARPRVAGLSEPLERGEPGGAEPLPRTGSRQAN